jgi:hypothetical protein
LLVSLEVSFGESAVFDVDGVDVQPTAVARVNAAARARTRSFFTVTVLSQVQTRGETN